jgi:GGDEF domain-containing protein
MAGEQQYSDIPDGFQVVGGAPPPPAYSDIPEGFQVLGSPARPNLPSASATPSSSAAPVPDMSQVPGAVPGTPSPTDVPKPAVAMQPAPSLVPNTDIIGSAKRGGTVQAFTEEPTTGSLNPLVGAATAVKGTEELLHSGAIPPPAAHGPAATLPTDEQRRAAMGGAAKVVGGAMSATAPFVAPAGIVNAPARAAMNFLLASGVSAGAHELAKRAGLSPEAQELAGVLPYFLPYEEAIRMGIDPKIAVASSAEGTAVHAGIKGAKGSVAVTPDEIILRGGILGKEGEVRIPRTRKPAGEALEPPTIDQALKYSDVPEGYQVIEEKPVHHTSDNVEDLRASAERQAPKIGDAVANAAENVPGAKVEAVRDSKDSDRIEDKAERQGVQPSQVGDIAAAKVTVPHQEAANQVLENLHQQMPVESAEGSVTGEPGKNAVRQTQALVNTGAPAGEPVKKAEVILQTPEMHEATEGTHDDYRKAQELRAQGKDAEAGELEAKIARDHEAAEQAARARQGEPDAIQKPSTGSIHERPQEEAGVSGSGRGRVEPIQQGQEAPAQSAQAAGQKEETRVGKAPIPPQRGENLKDQAVEIRDAKTGDWKPGTVLADASTPNWSGGQTIRRLRGVYDDGGKFNNVDIADVRKPQAKKPAVGVDFDGTLFKENADGSIGAPIPERIASLKQRIAAGEKPIIESHRAAHPGEIEKIHAALQSVGLPRLPVTAKKNAAADLIDDHAVAGVKEEKVQTNANTPLPEVGNDGKTAQAPSTVPSRAVSAEPTGSPNRSAGDKATQKVNVGPGMSPPPSKRWTADRGSIPGEPAYYLDGGPDDAKAALIEHENRNGSASKWEAAIIDHQGELQSLGKFDRLDDAARRAERESDLESKTIEAQPISKKLSERRTDLAERKRVSEMSHEERGKELLTSHVVDLPNRRAFDEAQHQPSKATAMSDADGLKAFNDTFGYEYGDKLLRAKAEALKQAGLDAYHDKGDEFLYRGASQEELDSKLEKARELLRNRVIEVEMKDGSVRRFKGADFSHGSGKDLAAAESGLKAHKSEREARGERARGELRGITEVGSGGSEVSKSPAQEIIPPGNQLEDIKAELRGQYPGNSEGKIDNAAREQLAFENAEGQKSAENIHGRLGLQRSKSPAAEVTPPKSSTVRLYRGESAEPGKGVPDYVKQDEKYKKTVEASGRWFSSDKAEAQHYADDTGNGRLTYIDVPADEAAKYEAYKHPEASKFIHATKRGGKSDEYFVPRELAKTAQPHVESAAAEVEKPTKYKFGNTQANIPDDSEAAKGLDIARSIISTSDLAGKGKDIGDGGNHVTVRYGIDGDDTEGIKKFLSQQAPFEATLGKTEKFPPSEHSDGAAVIVAPINAPELHRLNAELEKHGKFTEPSFKEYKPHATVAYVDPEKANRYVGMTITQGAKFPISEIAISKKDGSQEVVKLEGKKPVERKPGQAPVPVKKAKPESSKPVVGTKATEIQTIAGKMSLDEFENKGYGPEQVTQSDWVKLQRAARHDMGQREESGPTAAPYSDYEEYHHDAVKKAIAKGEDVDPEVLKDYPDLRRPEQKEPWEQTFAEQLGTIGQSKEGHGKVIKEALAAGKPVPERVLKDYPNLQPPQKARPESLKTAEDAGRQAGQASRRGDRSLAQDIMAGNGKYLNGQPEGVRKEILAAFNKAYHAEADKPVEWHNLDEKIVWRGKTMTRSEAIAKEPAANDEILAARPADSYGPKAPRQPKTQPPTEKIAEAAGKTEPLEARAEREGAKRLTPEEAVSKSGKNFEGRYLQAALEPAQEAWDKIEAKYADHTVSWGKDTEHNRREGLRVNMHDKGGTHVAALDVRKVGDGYQVYAPGYVKGSTYGNQVIQVLENVSDFSTAKKIAESRLRSGQVYNPDAMWHQKNGVGKGLSTSEVSPASSLKPDNAKPAGFKEEKLLVKVPDDGTFVIPNHPGAIDRAIDAADKFVPEKEPSSFARRIPKSPAEFNTEKYITGLEKEIATLQDDLAKALPNQKVYVAEQLKAARENLAEAKKQTPESILAGEEGSFSPGALHPARIHAAYQKAVEDFISGKLKIGDKYYDVAKVDPEVAHALHLIDNKPMDMTRHAQANVAKVTKGLADDQIRLASMMVDSDSRDFLKANKPDEYKQAMQDPKIMQAVSNFDPLWQELTKDRQALGWPVRQSLHMEEDPAADGKFAVKDRQGKIVESFDSDAKAMRYIDKNAEPEPHLKRTYPEHSRSPLPFETGTGPYTGSYPHEKGLRPPKMDKKQREMSAQYFYDHGRKDFSGYVESYKQTKEAIAKQELFNDFTKRATPWTAGTAQPSKIKYNGKEYVRPDIALKAKQGKTELPAYGIYDPTRGEKFAVKSGISASDRWLGPKQVVDAMENYDKSRGGDASSIRKFFQEQIVGLFGPAVHVNNILRRVGQTAGLGTFDPRSWPSIARVIASPDLRARLAKGVDDATIAMLSREGAWVDWNDIGNQNAYIGGNLNPSNWIRAFGKGVLFDPKFAGGWGGLDPKARVIVADYLKDHYPEMTDQQIANAVNDGLGNYNRANWTARQRMLAKFTLFPGWDTASVKWFLRKPFVVGVAGSLAVLAVNQALKALGKNKGDDSTDLHYIHIGDRKYSTGLLSDNMGQHMMAPILGALQAKLQGDDVGAGAVAEGMKGSSTLAGTLAGPVVEMIADQVYNRKYAGGATELVTPEDKYIPGTWAPNQELEKRIAFAALKGSPALNRFIDNQGHWDWAQGLGGAVLGVTNYKYGAEERLKANLGKASVYGQTLNQLAEKDERGAAEFVKDPTKATYLMFHDDLQSLGHDLKEIDDQIARVRSSDLPASERQSALEDLKGNRNELLKAADGLNDALQERKAQARKEQASYWQSAVAGR